MGAKLRQLAAAARNPLRDDPPDGGQLDRPAARPRARGQDRRAPRGTGSPCSRSTRPQGALQLSPEADSSNPAASGSLRFPWPIGRSPPAGWSRGTETGRDGIIAEVAVPIALPGPGGRRDRLLGPGLGHRAHRHHRPSRDPRRRRDRPRPGPDRQLPGGRRPGPARPTRSSWPPSRSRAGSSATRSRSTRPMSSASWRSPSTRCSTSSSSSSRPARSSSPLPRTSCARPCSRSEASSSCSRTMSSTPRPGAAFSARSAIRSIGWASSRSTSSTYPAWSRARWSCAPRRWTWAS